MKFVIPFLPHPTPKRLLLYFWWRQRASGWSPLLLRSIEILLLGLIGHGSNSTVSTLYATQNMKNICITHTILTFPLHYSPESNAQNHSTADLWRAACCMSS